jgi:hypothetical protein
MISIQIPKSFLVGIAVGAVLQSITSGIFGILIAELVFALFLAGSYFFLPELLMKETGFFVSILEDNINKTLDRWAPSYLVTRLTFRIAGFAILVVSPAHWALGAALICPTICYADLPED